MSAHHARKSWVALAVLTGIGTACASPEDPFTSGPAHATVTGLVTSPVGTPIPTTPVRITCGDGATPVTTRSDSTGRYVANLASGDAPFEGGSGHLFCRFTEPADGPARIEVDAALAFVRGPVLVALQFVDLHEP